MSAALLDRVRRGECLRDLDITDVHGHIGRYNFSIPDTSVATMVSTMDRVGIARLITSHMRCMSGDVSWGNDRVAEAMREFPGRVLGYLSFWPSDAAAVRRELERHAGAGFSGIKLHNANGFAYDHPAYEPGYGFANERRMLALFHTWGGEQEFKELRVVSARYPDLSILLAHSGCANEDGYIRMAAECPNVYLDLAFSRSFRGLVARLVRAAGADRVIWGSDGYFFDQAQQLGKVAGADIPEADKRSILSGNAARLLARVRG